MMLATPNEIEQKLGLLENSLTVKEQNGSYSFEPPLTAEQERRAIALLNGNADNPDYLGFDNALLNPDEGLSLFWFVRSMADAHPAPVGNAYADLSRAITKGLIIPSTPLDPFQSCINNLFGALASVSNGFTPAQTELMRSLLDKYGFGEIQFPIGG